MPTPMRQAPSILTLQESSNIVDGQDTSTLAGDVMALNEPDGTNGVATKKKLRKEKSLPIPNENHMKLRAVSNAGSKWELDLERVHGLTDGEACRIVGLVAELLSKDEFPDFDRTSDKDLALAEEGWRLFKDYDELLAKYHKEKSEQICRQGVWRMVNPIT
jgi:hypothetical protein